jgi:hypothetical protein
MDLQSFYDGRYLAVKSDTRCNIINLADGSVVKKFPEEDTAFIHVIRCEISSVGFNVISTDGTNTEIQAYEYSTETWDSAVIEGYKPTHF